MMDEHGRGGSRRSHGHHALLGGLSVQIVAVVAVGQSTAFYLTFLILPFAPRPSSPLKVGPLAGGVL
jgi:hypothetical protein